MLIIAMQKMDFKVSIEVNPRQLVIIVVVQKKNAVVPSTRVVEMKTGEVSRYRSFWEVEPVGPVD